MSYSLETKLLVENNIQRQYWRSSKRNLLETYITTQTTNSVTNNSNNLYDILDLVWLNQNSE